MDSTVVAAWIAVGGVAMAGAFTVGGTMLGAKLGRDQAKEIVRETAKLERQRFYDARVWEERKIVYSALVAKLLAYRVAASHRHDGFNDGVWHPEEFFASKEFKEVDAQCAELHGDLRTIYNDGRLMVSPAFAARYDEFRDEFLEMDYEMPPARAERAYNAAVSAYDDLLTLALEEIAP